ncbi:MAG TPA: NHLP family bacteriocin export ABC transporter peptidase/permease/ATPase subunit [Usitatibacteraceae bacterium]|nr:NHLP family bacteriocin export ABC transporter peptidase/permease/ATPase subunit [Usitatibacteraceae bacterium]
MASVAAATIEKPPAATKLADTPLARVPTILQLEAVECGAAALAMVLAHHGRHVPLEVLRSDCGVTRDGSKAGGLLRAARGYGLVARGFRKEPGELAAMALPAIVFWNFNHFVVLEGFRDGHAHLNDPAMGARRVDAAEFDQGFTGVVLTFERGPDFKPGGKAPSVLRSLASHLAGLGPSVSLAVILGLALVAPGLALPWLMGRFVDEVLAARLPGVAETLIAGLLAAALARGALAWLQAQVLTQAFTRAALGSARRFFSQALALPMDFFVQRSPGEIASRVALNEQVAETVSADLAHLVLDLVTAVFFLVLMLRLDAGLTAIVAGCLAFELLALRAVNRRMDGISQRLSVQAGKLSGMATGGLSNIESIKAGGQEGALFLKWLGLQVQFANTAVESQRVTLALMQVPSLAGLVAQLGVLGLGALRIMEGAFSVGDLVAYQVLLAGFTAPVHALFGAARGVQSLRGDMARIDDVLNHTPEPGVVVNDSPVSAVSGARPRTLELRDVTFGYGKGGAPLIEGFSLKIDSGRRVALVGASGSGKSTIARLAAGLYRPWSGEILFDGLPRESYVRDELARAVSYVDQDVVLFEGSVRDNLTMWDPLAEDEIIRSATRHAAIEDEIGLREGGLDAPLQEGARNLSGGQRQRIEIARALARGPSILLLDEATSALDTATEAIVEDNLRRRGTTCLVIAHRLSTVRDADEILVLEGGRVVERGTHAQLAAIAGGRYAALVAGETGEA